MKLSPMIKYHIAFWSITGPVGIFLVALLIPCVLISVIPAFRYKVMNWFDSVCDKFIKWRSTTYIKRYYYKAHLFDILKG